MGRLRPLSGGEVLRILEAFGFEEQSRRGSHIKLRRLAESGHRQTLVVPAHRDLDKGTLNAIFRQAARFIEEEKLRPHFFVED